MRIAVTSVQFDTIQMFLRRRCVLNTMINTVYIAHVLRCVLCDSEKSTYASLRLAFPFKNLTTTWKKNSTPRQNSHMDCYDSKAQSPTLSKYYISLALSVCVWMGRFLNHFFIPLGFAFPYLFFSRMCFCCYWWWWCWCCLFQPNEWKCNNFYMYVKFLVLR